MWPVGPVAEWAGLLGRSPVGGGLSVFSFFLFVLCFALFFLCLFVFCFLLLFHSFLFKSFSHFIKRCLLPHNYLCNIWRPPNIFVSILKTFIVDINFKFEFDAVSN